MINLLPPIQKEELRERDQLIIILNFFIFLFFSLLVLSLLLSAVKSYFFGILEEKKFLLKEKEKTLNLELEKEIKKTNDLLKEINSFYKTQILFFPILENILNEIPPEIKLESLETEFKEKEGFLVKIGGKTEKRDYFLKFLENLRGKYKEISFSKESLLKEKEIDFWVNFKIK